MTFDGLESKGKMAWKSWIGKRVLDSKCSIKEEIVVERAGRKEDPWPAFRIRVFIWVILFSERVDKRAWTLSSGAERVRVKGMMRSLLPSALGRALRSEVEVAADRTVATTVVFARWRRVAVMPSPIPVRVNRRTRDFQVGEGGIGVIGVIPLFAPVIKYIVEEDILECLRWFFD